MAWPLPDVGQCFFHSLTQWDDEKDLGMCMLLVKCLEVCCIVLALIQRVIQFALTVF